MRKFKKIQTKLPINLKKEHAYIFKRREFYRMPDLKVKSKKNVFLTHYGIMLKNLVPVRYTLPNIWGKRKPNSGFFFQFYRKALEIYMVCRFGKSLKAIQLDKNKEYLFIYSPWFGYFSWVMESLPRILEVEDELESLTLILPESYSKKKFVMESLQLFPKLNYEIIPDGVHMHVPNVRIPELKPYTYVFDPETMRSYRDKLWDYIDSLDIQLPTYDKIYVSRKKAKNRKLENEDEVLEIMEKSDFKELSFEDYSFFEQVYLMKHCKVLAGVHGAGFANLSFMPEGSSLLELIKEYSSYKEERPSYWRLCSAIGIDYYIEYCKPVEYGNYDLWVGVNLICDIESLKDSLQLLDKK